MIPSIEPTFLTMLCDVIGGDSLLNDAELKSLLAVTEIADVSPGVNRRRRMYNALLAQQEKDMSAQTVSAFLNKITFHVQKTRGAAMFDAFLQDVNAVLSLSGYSLNPQGKVEKIETVGRGRILGQPEQRLKALREALIKREAHPDLLAACQADLLVDTNHFALVRAAARGLTDKIREKGDLSGTGAELVDQAYSMGWQGYPLLAFNTLRSESEIGEQYALLNLLKGFLLMFYDERSRLERPAFNITGHEALNLLMLCSMLHQKVDESVRTPR